MVREGPALAGALGGWRLVDDYLILKKGENVQSETQIIKYMDYYIIVLQREKRLVGTSVLKINISNGERRIFDLIF